MTVSFSHIRLFTAFVPALSILFLLSVVAVKVPGLFLGERFFRGGCWLQVVLAAAYAFLLCWKMQDICLRARWRRYSWLIFSFSFFGQLLLGIMCDSIFLLSGELHFPIPMMIIGGAVYRWEFGFMPLLLILTILLSGPAWCSHLCYFGALDNMAAGHLSLPPKPYKFLLPARYTILVLTVIVALVAKWSGLSYVVISGIVVLFGITGFFVMILSYKRHMMVHCSGYCPVGALVSLGKYISPFRFKINKEACTLCGACICRCRYGALSKAQIKTGKPGINCSYCGDCISACNHGALQYAFLNMNADHSQRIWLMIVITLQSCFLAIARV